MEQINHTQTMVLIIGVSEYPEDNSIPSIPNILANIQLLRSSLVNEEVIGIPESNISVSINETKSQIEKKLKHIAEKAGNKSSTLMIYYSGHGIYSPVDFQLYFTTHQTTRRDLEIDGINIDVFKNHIRRSRAGRKVVILDCCHSGAFIGAMGDVVSQIQSNVNGFEGTYVMTSAAEDEPSLYPVKSPDKPTYFTGKLIEIVNQGLDNDCQYCSLRDLYNRIEIDFRNEGLPCPQQSNFNKADQLLFWKNRLYHEKKPEDEAAWEETLAKNNKWAYHDFRKLFPGSKYEKLAKHKIKELEEEEYWQSALRLSTVFSFTDYLDIYPEGRYAEEANNKLTELRYQHEHQEEKRLWTKVSHMNDLASYQAYLKRYPQGSFAEACRKKIEALHESEVVEEQKRKVLEDKKRQEQEQEEERMKEAARKKEEVANLEAQRKREEQLAWEKRFAEEAEQKIEAEKQAEEKREEKKSPKKKELIIGEETFRRGGLILAETPYSGDHPIVSTKKIAIIAGIGVVAIILIKVVISIINNIG